MKSVTRYCLKYWKGSSPDWSQTFSSRASAISQYLSDREYETGLINRVASELDIDPKHIRKAIWNGRREGVEVVKVAMWERSKGKV